MPALKSTATRPRSGSASASVRLSAFGWLFNDHHSYWRASSVAPISCMNPTRSFMNVRFDRYSGDPSPSAGRPGFQPSRAKRLSSIS